MIEIDLKHIQQVRQTATCLHNASAVNAAYDNMALQITESLQDKNPLVISVMNGGLISTGQLLLRLEFPLQTDFIHATRYRNHTQGAATLGWKVYPDHDLANRHILLVDDILDEGKTLYEIIQYCNKQNAASTRTAVLVDKRHNRRKPSHFKADFTGLNIEDRFVFGCGMDYQGYLRNASGIYAVDETLISS